MLRVPVISKDGTPLMPTKASRARRMLRDGKAKLHQNDLNQFAIQLMEETVSETQLITVGFDPGKCFTGLAVQSAKLTLWAGHLVLPYRQIRKRMETRGMMRRTRRSRRIDRNLHFHLRSHRQKRFQNRVAGKLPPSIRGNRDLEFRVFQELYSIYPIGEVVYEVVKANGSKSFSPVMVGQKQSLDRLSKFDSQRLKVTTKMGWETSVERTALGLAKDRAHKSLQSLETHANDAIALASFPFRTKTVRYFGRTKIVNPTIARVTQPSLTVVSRPPLSRRQLHLLQLASWGKRRKYGGTTTRHGLRKGDYVEAKRSGKTYRGWVSGDTKTQVSVSDSNWKRIAQFSAKKVRLLSRNCGLIVKVIPT